MRDKSARTGTWAHVVSSAVGAYIGGVASNHGEFDFTKWDFKGTWAAIGIGAGVGLGVGDFISNTTAAAKAAELFEAGRDAMIASAHGVGRVGSNTFNSVVHLPNGGLSVLQDIPALSPRFTLNLSNITLRTVSTSLSYGGASSNPSMPISTNALSVSGGGAQSQGGGHETPGWITNTGRVVGALLPGNTTKEVLIDYARTTGNIGKAGTRYLNIVKGTGFVGSLFGVGVSAYNITNDYNRNGNGFGDVDNWDLADASVGLAGLGVSTLVTLGLLTNPIGWGVAIGTGIYFGARLIYDIANDE